MSLDALWFIVIMAAMTCYMMLDGFDMGVGALHLFTKKDEDRRIFLNAIGPVWDGNEVWLVIIIGALFAGFPDVYATLLTSFYGFIMVLLCGLIFRASAIEFRSKHESKRWRATWDVVFSVASVIMSSGTGFMLGNLVVGIPLDAHRNFLGNFWDFFTPYPILMGILSLSLCMMHGAIFLVMKTEGELQKRLRVWVNATIFFFITCYLITTAATLIFWPHMVEKMQEQPWLFSLPVLAFLSIFNVPRLMHKKREGSAFIFSCLSIAFLLSLFAIGTYPIMIRSSVNPEQHSLLVQNSASSPLTLKILLLIVGIGLPLVFAYGYYVYRIFRGKVRLEKHSY